MSRYTDQMTITISFVSFHLTEYTVYCTEGSFLQTFYRNVMTVTTLTTIIVFHSTNNFYTYSCVVLCVCTRDTYPKFWMDFLDDIICTLFQAMYPYLVNFIIIIRLGFRKKGVLNKYFTFLHNTNEI